MICLTYLMLLHRVAQLQESSPIRVVGGLEKAGVQSTKELKAEAGQGPGDGKVSITFYLYGNDQWTIVNVVRVNPA